MKKPPFILLLILGISLTPYQTNAETQTSPLSEISYYPAFKLNAQVIGLEQTQLSPQINGNFTEILVEIGDTVKRNQILAKLDCTLHRYNLQAAQVRLKQTERRLELLQKQINRQRALLSNNNISEDIVDQTETEKSVMESNREEQLITIKSLLYTLSLCDIRAPFDGTVIDRQAQLGQAATPGVSSFFILNSDKILISVEVPQHMVNDFEHAQTHFFIQGDTRHPISVSTVLPRFSKNRTQEFRLKVQTPLIIGSKGVVNWRSSQAHLPPEHLKRYQDQLGLYVIRNKTIEFASIAFSQEGRANALTLAPDTEVIISSSSLPIVGQNISE